MTYQGKKRICIEICCCDDCPHVKFPFLYSIRRFFNFGKYPDPYCANTGQYLIEHSFIGCFETAKFGHNIPDWCPLEDSGRWEKGIWQEEQQ